MRIADSDIGAGGLDPAGRYRPGALVGVGRTALVFRGELIGVEGFRRPVAIKRIRPRLALDPGVRARFVGAARLSPLVCHANIVEVLDVGRDQHGRLYQVLELVDGLTLGALIASGPLSEVLAAHCVDQLLRALHHGHHAADPHSGRPLGAVHGHCAPAGVLVSWSGDLKLSSFAPVMAAGAGRGFGHPGYASPEQRRGHRLDGRTDLFAIGVVLRELLGQRVRRAGPRDRGAAAGGALGELAAWLSGPDPAARPADAGVAMARLHATGLVLADGAQRLAAELAGRFPGRAPIRAPERRRAARSRAASSPARRAGRVATATDSASTSKPR